MKRLRGAMLRLLLEQVTFPMTLFLDEREV